MSAYVETIREQAREAVEQSLRYDVIAWHPQATDPVGDAADAASDVWQSHVERLMGALRAAGVSDRLVEAIARGGDPDGGLVANDGD